MMVDRFIFFPVATCLLDSLLAVVPLTGIEGCKANRDGLCKLPTFISSMKKRIAQVNFAFDCFANYTIPIPDTIIDGQFPSNSNV